MIGTLTKIISGAQTGADRGALDAALAAGLQIGGWAPQGWRAEDGCIPLVFRQYMKQSISPEYTLRTRLNVQDSDATLVLSFSERLTGGTKLTLEHVKAQRKPCKHLVLPRGRGVVPAEVTSAVWEWLQAMRVGVLNVAGPRESKEPGIQAAAKRVIAGLLRAKQDADTAAALALQDAEADAVMATEAAQAAEERAESLRRMIDMGLQMRPACAECGSTVPCACAMKAYAVHEIAAAKEALDRKDELFASGKYREASGPVQGLDLEHITQRVEFEAEDMLSRLHNKERERRAPRPPEELIGALQDRIHPASGRLLAAKSVGKAPTPQESLPVAVPVAVFIADCSIAECPEDFMRKRTGLIDRYYAMDGNGVGGSLHIVLDDGNHDRGSVQFCLDWAIREGDRAGEALARALLALPDDVYAQVLPPMEDPCEGCGGVEGLHAADCKRGMDA